MRAIEQRFGQPIEQVLVDAFNRHGSLQPAAHSLGIDYTTLSKWMSMLDVELRTTAVLAQSA